MNDDELLNLLRDVLVPDAVVPSPDQIVLLHRAVDSRPPPARRGPRRIVASCLIGAGVIAGAGGALAASGAVLPEPIRVVAHAVGLPVDSPAVAEARAARRALQESLEQSDKAATATATKRLRDALSDLSTGDRADLGDVSSLLHQGDDQASSGQDHPNDNGSPSASTEPATTTSNVDTAPTSTAQSDQPTTVGPDSTTSTTELPDSTTFTTASLDLLGGGGASGAPANR